MEKLLALLQVKTEDEAIAVVKALAARPVIFTISLDNLGSINASVIGNPSPEQVEEALTGGMKLIQEALKKQEEPHVHPHE